MGCDIHWNSETKKDGKWVCDQARVKPSWADEDGEYLVEDFPDPLRDYCLFGLLANGVRSNWEWAFPYQDAVPDDLSPEVAKRIEHEDSDGHSHGVHTRAELMAKHEELKLKRAEYLIAPPSEANWVQALAHHSVKLEELVAALDADVPADDQRIVFWFDN